MSKGIRKSLAQVLWEAGELLMKLYVIESFQPWLVRDFDASRQPFERDRRDDIEKRPAAQPAAN